VKVKMYSVNSQTARNVKSNTFRIAVLFEIFASNAHAAEPLECLIDPHRLVAITSSEIGVLASVNVDEADVVVKGDILAALRTDVENAV
jgi:hypothetical protein